MPNPNQMMNTGAITMIGSVWDTISHGYTARRTGPEKSIAVASSHAIANDRANPPSVSRSVVSVFCHSTARCPHPAPNTAPGVGSACGSRTPHTAIACQAGTSPAASSAGGHR
jgi:hypothetical protein